MFSRSPRQVSSNFGEYRARHLSRVSLPSIEVLINHKNGVNDEPKMTIEKLVNTDFAEL